eukprot:5584510-Pleurochrysis_carterae.AAC.1
MAALEAEKAGSPLTVGLYGRWGGGKSMLWKQIKRELRAEVLRRDVTTLRGQEQEELPGAVEAYKAAIRAHLDSKEVDFTQKQDFLKSTDGEEFREHEDSRPQASLAIRVEECCARCCCAPEVEAVGSQSDAVGMYYQTRRAVWFESRAT